MARILTIFGLNESSRRDLFFEKFSKGQNEQKYFKKFSENFSKNFKKIGLSLRLFRGVGALGFPRRWWDLTWLGPASWLCLAWPCLGWLRLGWPWPGFAPAGVGLSRISLAKSWSGLASPSLAPPGWASLGLALPVP